MNKKTRKLIFWLTLSLILYNEITLERLDKYSLIAMTILFATSMFGAANTLKSK